MIINYNLKIIKNNIFVILVKNKYDLGMLFFRVQEFYEGVNSKFRSKKYCVWDYFKWYASEYGGCFSYPKDYCGYNVPVNVALNCYKKNKIQSPYDETFVKILSKIKIEKGYIIGCDNLKSDIYKHELCHALYYTNSSYRDEMDSVTKSIPKNVMNKFKKNLKQKGYCSAVTLDEIQAYMAIEKTNSITTGVKNTNQIHKKYKEIFNKYS